ncbi:MAG TPA: DegT/DnrJ/EryC1/StrS family aminotransferase [bacterium]|nr:DegT/DnrJ/EryC1/StrS family aminotransferase [bacterium]
MGEAAAPVRYRCLWTPFDDEMREATLRPAAGPVYYDGPEVEAFEREAAAYLGVARGVGVSSGTTALHLAMLAMGIGPGDEVVCAANAYLTAPECTIHVGATPVYCDVLDETANLDASTVEPVLTPRTKVIVAIHNYGHPVDMDPLMGLARRRGLFVIEDIAHAFGARYKGRPVGSIGHASFTSFARKVVTVAGQGGMAFTSEPEWARRMALLRRHGWESGAAYRGRLVLVGFNHTLGESLAAVGRVSLSRVDRENAVRRANALRYTEGLARLNTRGVAVRLPVELPYAAHSWFHYVVRTPRRDDLVAFLSTRGIEAGIHYRHTVYREPAYVARTGVDPGPRPVADRIVSEIMTLPSHPEMGGGIDYVLGQLAEFPWTATSRTARS